MDPAKPTDQIKPNYWAHIDESLDSHGLGVLNNTVNLLIKASLWVRPEPKPNTYEYYLKEDKSMLKCLFFIIPGAKQLYNKWLSDYKDKILENKGYNVPDEWKKDVFQKYGSELLKTPHGKVFIIHEITREARQNPEPVLIHCFSPKEQLELKKEVLMRAINFKEGEPLPDLFVSLDSNNFYRFSTNEKVNFTGTNQQDFLEGLFKDCVITHTIRKEWIEDVLKDPEFAETPIGQTLQTRLKDMPSGTGTTIEWQ